MHGLGNDFVVIDARPYGEVPEPATVRRLSDRRRGIGCDLVMVLLPPASPQADIFARFFNADGSEPEGCGNATRCAARLLLDEIGRERGVVQTIAGLLPVWRDGVRDGLPYYAVEMGTPEYDWRKIPLATAQDTLQLDLAVGPLVGPCAVNVGNPHAVFFVDDAATVDLERWGPQIEHHALFPRRINVEICQVLAPDKLRMRVWERGVGITQACGTGATATFAAAVRRGLAARRAEVVLDGGSLFFDWRVDGPVVMSGPAAMVYTGELADDFFPAP